MSIKYQEMQYKFAQNYISNGFDAYRAAIHAGYSESSANCKTASMLTYPIVSSQVDQVTANLIDPELERRYKIRIKDKLKVLAKIVYTITGKTSTNKKIIKVEDKKLYDVAMRAIDMLNRMQGHYMPERKLSVTVDATKKKLLEAKRVYEEY